MQGLGLTRNIRRRSRRLRATLLAIVGALSLGTVGILLATDALHRMELLTVDSRFELRGTQPAPSDIAVVGIDDKTFDSAPSWPFPRGMHAGVIRQLVKAGAKVIAYDVQFTERSPKGLEAEDEKLLNAVYKARGKIVMATTEVDEKGRTAVLGGEKLRKELGAKVGNAVTPADANGVVRRIFPRIQGLDTFASVAADMYAGRRLERAPSDGAWIDFHGPPRTLSYASFGDVLEGKVDPATFKGKVVVVGAVAPSLQDVAATSASGDELMSGPEIQAEAISTLLEGQPISETSGAIDVLIALLMAAIAPLAALRVRAVRGFIGAVVLGALYLGLTQLMFNGGEILPVAVPLTGLIIGAVGSLGALLVVEALERQRVRDVFSHFVPHTVVDDVLDRAGSELTLGGTQRECTLLFSDLRGFTSYSEGKPPEEVIDILNDYLSEMTNSIIDCGGTLISFMGDGIMALFGAPLDQPDHRDRAVEAARKMLQRLDAFNERRGAAFRMGIGINTGTVMCGNVGSERRLEYTAIGDTVNTCSRIEGMTKDTGVPVHVAESTILGLERADGFHDLGWLAVRGREQKIHLYGLAEYAQPPKVTRFDAAAVEAEEPVA